MWDTKDNIGKRTMLSLVIERIEVSPHPAGVASSLTPKKDENPEAFARRLGLHQARVLKQRVSVDWWH